ncbi:hypothetical protein BD408DRAFT_427039 [Parasitella parasitica]|nr:hypothetical protein BD408DRAFT_427039 [Parasitella parasitica]
MLLHYILYILIFDYLRCKCMHFVLIIAGITRYTSLILVPITRKQYTRWRVSSAVVIQVWFSLRVKWMAYH